MSGYHLITLTYDKLRTYLNAPNYRLLPLVGSSLSRMLLRAKCCCREIPASYNNGESDFVYINKLSNKRSLLL